MLLARRLNDLTEVEQLVERFAVEEVGQALAPAVFELDQDLHQLDVVLQLRVDHFNVLVVLAQQRLEVSKRFLDALSQISDGFRLGGADPSKDSFRGEEDLAAQVVAAHALGVGDGVDLAENGDQFGALVRVLGRVHHDAPAGLLFLLDLSQIFICLNRLRNVTPGICFDQH